MEGVGRFGRRPCAVSVPRSIAQIECDVGDHVFLPADQVAPSDLDEDRAGVEAVDPGGGFGVPQKARVDPGVSEGECLPVDLDRAVLQGADQIVGRILQTEQVAGVLPAVQIRDRDERLDRAVACAGAPSGEGRVDPDHAFLHRRDRVRHRQRQVLLPEPMMATLTLIRALLV